MKQRQIRLEESEGQGKLSCSSTFHNLFDIFKKVYKRRSNSTKQEIQVLNFLRLRAWIAHSLYTLLRLYNWFDGRSDWLKKNIDKPCLDDEQVEPADESSQIDCVSSDYRDDFRDKVQPWIQIVSITILIISVLLDIMCFKWRFLADYILYEE